MSADATISVSETGRVPPGAHSSDLRARLLLAALLLVVSVAPVFAQTGPVVGVGDTGAIKYGDASTLVCDVTTEGTLRYSGGGTPWEWCDSTTWQALGGGTTPDLQQVLTVGESGLNRLQLDQDQATGVYDDATVNAPYSRVNADSFHTNGLGVGQIFIEGRAIDSNSIIEIGRGVAGGQAGQDIYLGNNNELVVDTSANYVGIGTASPATLLHVAGAATIDTTLNMTSGVISNVADPVAAQDAATKGYVDAAILGGGDNLGNHTATTTLNMNGNQITNAVVNAPTYYLPSGSATIGQNRANDGVYEWFGWYSGGTRSGIMLWDGAWTGCPGGNSFCIAGDADQLVLFSNNGMVLVNDSLDVATDIRAPIVYDRDNTGYYVNPASTSNMNALTLAGTLAANNGISVDGNTVIDNGAGWHRSYGNTGWYNGTHGGGVYMIDTTWVRTYNNKAFYANATIRSDVDMRAPIFYDQNNTGYFVDPASTSVMNRVTIAGGSPGAGKVLTSDAGGLASWETPSGNQPAAIISTQTSCEAAAGIPGKPKGLQVIGHRAGVAVYQYSCSLFLGGGCGCSKSSKLFVKISDSSVVDCQIDNGCAPGPCADNWSCSAQGGL